MEDKISVISDTLHGLISLSSFEKAVMSTTLFNRLHGIYQNSTAYLTFPTNRTRRVEHSFGTMYLCGNIYYAGICNAAKDTIKDFMAAARRDLYDVCSYIMNDDKITRKLGDKIQKFKQEYKALEIEGGLYNKYLPSNILGCDSDVDKDYKKIYIIMFESVRIAALLHDVGHPPFSHISENALNTIYQKVSGNAEKTAREQKFMNIMKPYTGTCAETGKPKQLHEEMGNQIAELAIFEAIPDITEIEAKDKELYRSQAFKLVVRQMVINILTEKTPLCKDLHMIIDGTLDGDRLDYVSRDPINSGFSTGRIEYDRLIDSIKLMKKDENFLFCPCTSVCNTIEDFLQRRWNMYKNIIYHHRVIKTDYLLQHVIVLIAMKYLGEATEKNDENLEDDKEDNFILPYDISGLWKAIQHRTSSTERVYALSQWDDTWLMTILKKSYFEKYMEDEGVLHKQLEELLTNRKNYFSLIKRKEEFLVIDRAAAESMLSRQGSLEETIRRVQEKAKETSEGAAAPDKQRVNIEAYIAQVKSVWDHVDHYVNNGSLVETQGFLLHSVIRLFPDGVITPLEDVIRMAVDEYCGHDESYFSVYKMPKTGTNNDQYLYNKRNPGPKETVALNQISNISNVLREDLKFSPFFFIYVDRKRIEEKGFDFDQTRKDIGHKIGEVITREIQKRLEE